MSDAAAEFGYMVSTTIVLLIFLFVIVGGFIIGWDDARKRQELLKKSPPVNPGPPQEIINSDGKPDLPNDPK